MIKMLIMRLGFDAYCNMKFENLLNSVYDGGLVLDYGFGRYKALKDLKEELLKQYYDLQELVSGLVPLCTFMEFYCGITSF